MYFVFEFNEKHSREAHEDICRYYAYSSIIGYCLLSMYNPPTSTQSNLFSTPVLEFYWEIIQDNPLALSGISCPDNRSRTLIYSKYWPDGTGL